METTVINAMNTATCHSIGYMSPFDKRDAHLVESAGTCADCPKRTGHNKLLFCDLGKQDACTDPSCYRAKVDAHVAKQIAAKPELERHQR